MTRIRLLWFCPIIQTISRVFSEKSKRNNDFGIVDGKPRQENYKRPTLLKKSNYLDALSLFLLVHSILADLILQADAMIISAKRMMNAWHVMCKRAACIPSWGIIRRNLHSDPLCQSPSPLFWLTTISLFHRWSLISHTHHRSLILDCDSRYSISDSKSQSLIFDFQFSILDSRFTILTLDLRLWLSILTLDFRFSILDSDSRFSLLDSDSRSLILDSDSRSSISDSDSHFHFPCL